MSLDSLTMPPLSWKEATEATVEIKVTSYRHGRMVNNAGENKKALVAKKDWTVGEGGDKFDLGDGGHKFSVSDVDANFMEVNVDAAEATGIMCCKRIDEMSRVKGRGIRIVPTEPKVR